MGCSWSLWFAQEINRAQVLSAGMPAETESNAHSMDCSFEKHKERFVVYVDNIAVLGLDAETVDKLMGKISLNTSGLLTHEHVPACTDCELWGLRVDGKRKELRMSSRRYWRIKYALEGALQARRVSGKQLERIIGHTTFASLLERGTLSIPHTVYKLIRKHYDSTARLWKASEKSYKHCWEFCPP